MRRILKNARVRKQCHILTMLKKQAKSKHVSLHTPGHKNAKFDITELSYSDNLSSPKGVLKQAQDDIAHLLGAKQSFILTDGSTCGVLSMLFAAQKLGAKCVLAREDSHKSLYNGCALLGLELLLLPTQTHQDIPLPFTVKALENNPDFAEKADVIFLTSPDYFGNVADLKGIRDYCDIHKKLLVIDGAHGGHLHFDKRDYAGAFADFWVDGAHKSLPALTQGAVVSARTENQASALALAVDTFRTTSPSYPIMASVEYAVKYPENKMLIAFIQEWQKHERIYQNTDWTKVCLLFGDNAVNAEKYLQSKGVFAEFCDGNVVCLYFSPAMSLRKAKWVQRVVNKAFALFPYQAKQTAECIPVPTVSQTTQVEWVYLAESENRVLASNIGLFPPCIPLKKQGERMDRQSIESMQKAGNVFGVQNGKIAVYKND